MASEMLERDDLSVYIVAGLPRSFKKKLQQIVQKEAKADGELMLLDDELTQWVVSKVQGDKRRSHEKTPSSAALWRAFRALSAALFHLQDQEMKTKVRELRREVEDLWHNVSPLHEEEEDEDDLDGDDLEVDVDS